MGITLEELSRRIEEDVPTAKALPISHANQIIISFSDRPDVEVSLLTPWYQMRLSNGILSDADIGELKKELIRLTCN